MQTPAVTASGTILHFTAMSGGSMTDTGPSCPNGSCALLSRRSVDLLQRWQSTLTGRCAKHHPGIQHDCLDAFGYYRVISSARNGNDWGIVMPSALAVLRMITSSNFEGCSTARSTGLAPFSTLSTNWAERRSRIGDRRAVGKQAADLGHIRETSNDR
jgi:hypothetical protein